MINPLRSFDIFSFSVLFNKQLTKIYETTEPLKAKTNRNVSSFEFSNRLGINILLKLVALFILLIFLAMPFAFMLT
jgi:hypothetical protein